MALLILGIGSGGGRDQYDRDDPHPARAGHDVAPRAFVRLDDLHQLVPHHCRHAGLNAAIVMLLIDRQLEAHFFLGIQGGSPLLWQHFFWTFGHPEVYIMALPAFGMISEVIPVFSRKPIFGYSFVAASTVAIAC
jgi:hypothetical protein